MLNTKTGRLTALPLLLVILIGCTTEKKPTAVNRHRPPLRRWSLAGLHIKAGSASGYRNVYIDRVEAGSPAQKAGIPAGATVNSIDNLTGLTLQQYSIHLRSKKPGTAVTITVTDRGGTTRRYKFNTAPFPLNKQLILLIKNALQGEDYERSSQLLRYAAGLTNLTTRQSNRIAELRRYRNNLIPDNS